MPSTDLAPAPPASRPAYDPFDDPATEAAAALPVDASGFPAPSLEDAFEEPAVERPEIVAEPTPVEQLAQARQAIDRELMRREAARGLDDELAVPPVGAEIDAPPPVFEEQSELAEELVVPEAPLAEDEPSAEEAAEEADGFDRYRYSESDDDALQFGREVEPLPPPTPEQLEMRRREIEQERIKMLAECDKLYAAVRADSIKDISLDIRLQGQAGEDFPFECEGRRPDFQPRNWAPVTYMWKASGLCHKPLYFEQVQLERYGHDWGPVLQPIMSGAHFFGTIPILPYKMGLQTPNECDYSLGYYRPGSCAPYMIEPLGFTWLAAAFQAGAVTGAAFAIPYCGARDVDIWMQ